MNKPFCSRVSRLRLRAFGTVLLALPWCGIAPSPALAQQSAPPDAAPPVVVTLPVVKLGVSPLSPAEKARIDKFIAIARFEAICKTQLDLKVENASPETVFKRIQDNFPSQTIPIASRGVGAASLSFDFKENNVGALLQTVADRTGSNLYVLSSGLLLAPASQLTDAERADVAHLEGGKWATNLHGGGQDWTSRTAGGPLIYRAVAREATGSKAGSPLLPLKVKTTWDSFSADSQIMLQQVANWCDRLPWFLHPGSPVEVKTTDQKHIIITFRAGINDSNQGAIATSFSLE